MSNTETFTIAEAAEKWIAMIEAPETKATIEQKEALIAKIRAAVPIAKIYGVGYPNGAPAYVKSTFSGACDGIKKVLRGEK